MKEKKKFSFTPEKLWGIAIFVFFAWFIFAFLVFPNLNTVVSVFYQNGHFTTEVFTKLVHSAKAMRSLRNSLILAPTLSIQCDPDRLAFPAGFLSGREIRRITDKKPDV